jgi:hypothetical protein
MNLSAFAIEFAGIYEFGPPPAWAAPLATHPAIVFRAKRMNASTSARATGVRPSQDCHDEVWFERHYARCDRAGS